MSYDHDFFYLGDGKRDGGDGAHLARGHVVHERVLVQGPPRSPLGRVSSHRYLRRPTYYSEFLYLLFGLLVLIITYKISRMVKC